MGKQRMIAPVQDNMDKCRTYREHKGKYQRAIENEFYFEALLIDYALIEDRLRSMLYHMGFLADRNNQKIWEPASESLRNIVSTYKSKRENDQLNITDISGKIKIIRCVLQWAEHTEGGYEQNPHLSALKFQCKGLNRKAFLKDLDALKEWCDYRNEVIHGLMNKNLESLSSELKSRTEEGMRLADRLDKQVRLIKKGHAIRNCINLETR